MVMRVSIKNNLDRSFQKKELRFKLSQKVKVIEI